MQTKNAIGNLINLYRAVLTKCNILNNISMLMLSCGLLLTPILIHDAHGASLIISIGQNGGDGGDGGEDGLGGAGGEGGLGGGAVNVGSSAGQQGETGAAGANGNDGSDGGYGGDGGGGGDGGTNITVSNVQEYNSTYGGGAISLGGAGGAGGDGGAGATAGGAGNGGDGGDGGSIKAYSNTFQIDSHTFSGNAYGSVAISQGGTGGNGGTGGDGSAQGGTGGDGGDGGDGNTVTANNNTTYIINGTVTNAHGGIAISQGGTGGTGGNGGTKIGDTTQNTGGNGGNGGASNTATANSNKVNITSATDTAYGGIAISQGGAGGNTEGIGGNGGASNTATANYNTVNITSGTTITNAYGGIAISQGGIGGDSLTGGDNGVSGANNTASAFHNNINIDGGTVLNNIVGGLVLGDNRSRAENNTVTLSNAPTLGNSTEIWGGAIINSHSLNASNINDITFTVTPNFAPNPNTFNDNTLNVYRYIGTEQIKSIGNFARYNFILPANTAANSTILTVTNLYLGSGSDGTATDNAIIGNVSIETGHNLKNNDFIILIDADDIDGSIKNGREEIVKSDTSTFTEQAWTITQDTTEHNIIATFIEQGLTPESDSSQSLAGGVVSVHSSTSSAVLFSAANTVATIAIPTAQTETQGVITQVTATSLSGGSNSGSDSYIQSAWAPFAVLHGGYNSFDSGVETDVTSISFVGGLANTSYYDSSELLLGLFVETGTGSYNSSTSTIDSNGNINYLGGGLFARYELYTANGLPYIEASARLGTINTDFKTNDIIDVTTGRGVNYETDSMYYGMHIGAGYIWNINEQWALDMSAKYFWTHQESIDKEIAGDNFNFDSINSHVLRVGATANYEMLENETYTFSPYFGLHYEHEFDSEAKASVENISIPNSASLEGGTGVLSLGAKLAHINGFSLNGKIEGSLGERDGVLGMFEVKYTF